jgi:hypothetical protein
MDDLFIMEAIGEEGVRLNPWCEARQFIGNIFDQVGWRKLNFDRSD